MGSLFFMSRCSVEWWFCCCLNFDHAKPHESSMPAINFVGVKCTGSTVCVHLYKCDALRDGCMRRSFSPFSLSKFTDCTQLSNRRADGTELWVNNRNGISSCGIGPLSQVFLCECLFNPALFFFFFFSPSGMSRLTISALFEFHGFCEVPHVRDTR